MIMLVLHSKMKEVSVGQEDWDVKVGFSKSMGDKNSLRLRAPVMDFRVSI